MCITMTKKGPLSTANQQGPGETRQCAKDQSRKLHNIPAQVAEPMTPEELQAMAVISR